MTPRTRGITYDLHVHSSVSDGTCSCLSLIDQAAALGLKGISFTDHDTIDPEVGRCDAHAASLGIRFIHGIEFSTSLSNVHVLGYNLDLSDPDLVSFLRTEQEKRIEAVKKMCRRAQKRGLAVSFEEVSSESASGRSLGRPHIASVLQKKGYVRNIYEAFERWLKQGQPVYASYEKYEPGFIIRKILQWKGVPVLAHLCLILPSLQSRVLSECLDNGLAGIEAYYPRFSGAQSRHCLDLAAKHRLLVTGGSDFHGSNKPDILLGSAGLDDTSFESAAGILLTRETA
jgi:predicted metal-dependent phosphoesterase TrpH